MTNSFETEQEYENALSRVYDLIQLEITDGSPESIELDNLATRIEAYEARHYPIKTK